MNKTLKWILIGLGIAIVAFLLAMVAFGFHRGGFAMMRGYGDFDGLNRGYGRLPMMGFMPMMAFGLLRGIFGLGILALAVIGIVLLVRNHRAKKAVPVAPVTPETPAQPEKLCAKCGQPVQPDWKVCPHCGKKQ
jgi:hypothetical protein